VVNTRRQRFTSNHADLSRAGLQLTRLGRRPAIEHILRRHRLTARPLPRRSRGGAFVWRPGRRVSARRR
jgi:hypothetical protein